MKISLVCFLLAFTASAVAADNSPVTGKWRVHTSIGGAESDQTCTFAESGGILSGSCESEDRGLVKITGRFDQIKVSWSYKTNNDDGDTISVQYVGRLDSGRITGSVTMPESGTNGDFIAMQAPDSSAVSQ